MSSISNINSSSSLVLSALTASSLRRQIQAELAEIHNQLNQFQQDEMSLAINDWYTHFSAALRLEADEQQVLNTFIGLLREILVESIWGTSLDDQSYLGTDLLTYSHKALCVYLNLVPIEFRNRSPFDPEDQTEFTVTPHRVVRHMVGWLERHDALFGSLIDLCYQDLVDHQAVPEVPRPLSRYQVMRRNLLAMREQEEKEERKEIDEFTRKLEVENAQRAQEVQQRLAPIQERVQETAARYLQEIQTRRNADSEQMRLAQGEIEQLETELDQLERREEELKIQISGMKAEIEKAKNDDKRLEMLINQTQQAIKKKRKKEKTRKAAIVGGCIIGTIALCCLGPAVFVPSKGGAKLAATLATF